LDNTPHAVTTQSRNSEPTICVQCIELKNQLKETMEELKSALLIIVLLQQESSTRITSNYDDINRNNLPHVGINQAINAEWAEVISRRCGATNKDKDKDKL
jgi:hypothetical protein